MAGVIAVCNAVFARRPGPPWLLPILVCFVLLAGALASPASAQVVCNNPPNSDCGVFSSHSTTAADTPALSGQNTGAQSDLNGGSLELGAANGVTLTTTGANSSGIAALVLDQFYISNAEVSSNASIYTQGQGSTGIDARAYGAPPCCDGAGGLIGGNINIQNLGQILTTGNQADGIYALSSGGNGGDGSGGGWFSDGNNAGSGGPAGTVYVFSGDDYAGLANGVDGIETTGLSSDAIHAVSVGGAAGNGGNGGLFGGGGAGGGGAAGGTVTVFWNGGDQGGPGTVNAADEILTTNAYSNGIFAQSLGGTAGDGGDGGFLFTSGGSAVAGGPGGTVNVTTDRSSYGGSIVTLGDYSDGIFAQSVGGGGGNAGAGGTVNITAIGSAGGYGGDGGEVDVSNTMTISTLGNFSHGIFAQSVGGGGGNGGSASGISAYGGSGAGGGVGGNVNVTNSGLITTGSPMYVYSGVLSDGIFAQSIGGGGGSGGNSSGAESLGGNGAGGGWGGDITVNNVAGGQIITYGDQARGIFAQSVGGGGGAGGSAVGALTEGGSGGGSGSLCQNVGNFLCLTIPSLAGYAGSVTVTNAGSITTYGMESDAIFAQSVGGGGGSGGDAGVSCAATAALAAAAALAATSP